MSSGPEGLVLEVGVSSGATLQHLTEDSEFPAPHRLTFQCLYAEEEQTCGSDALLVARKPHSKMHQNRWKEDFFAPTTKISRTF